MKVTGLSQPTITRAVGALTAAGLLRERRDLINTARPGRPVVPLELASWPAVMIGVALDRDDAVIGCYDSRGRMLREVIVSEFAKDHVCEDTLEYIVAVIYRLKNELAFPIKAIALGASSIHWTDFAAIRERLEFEFKVPAIATNAAAAIALAELQQDPDQQDVFVLYSDNTTSAAYIGETGIFTAEPILGVPEWLEYIISEQRPSQVLFSGPHFLDPDNRTAIKQRLNDAFGDHITLRVIRPDLETMRTITHALSLAQLGARPLDLARG